MAEDSVTLKEAAARVGVSSSTLRRWAERGVIRFDQPRTLSRAIAS